MGQMDPLLAQFIRSSTFEITNSAVLERPGDDPVVEGGGGGGEGEGVWIEAAAREWDARSERRWDWLRGDVMPFLDREGFCFCVCF